MRRRLARSGQALAALGASLAMQLPLPPAAAVAIAAAFAAQVAWQLHRLERGWRRCTRIRLFPGGRAQLLDGNGHWQPARLAPGSVVLPRIAWLCFELGDGSRVNEALQGDPGRCDNWRRLRVIYRHIGAAR